MASQAKAAVVGAGFLGREVARALGSTRPVIATTRDGVLEGAPPGVEARALDLLHASAEDVRGALEGAQALVLCYAAGRGQDRRALYVDGARRLLEALAARPPRRVVYTSSTSALADAEGWVDEDDARWPESERGRVQREGEAVVQELCGRLGIPWVILRLAGLYGPGRGLGRIYRDDPTAILAGDGMQATNLIHRDDALAAVLAAVDAPPELSALIHVCDDDHRPRREMYALLAEARGEPPPRWERAPSDGQVHGKRVANRRLGELLGVRLRHPLHVLDP
ncbi:MAG: NAD(P)H-binding protein [Myxococcales bacterium]|nr:NAD(P)H-binding protein [Myxococcales bacterium]